ncbi:MAG: LCP family protein [Clostridia bacterium]|nr:LCP family protein [Clostridia bacterium]
MDDIYFSDKKKRNPDNDKNTRRYSHNEFTDTDYFNESFDLDLRKKGSSQAFSDKSSFRVQLPDEDSISEGPADRTPKGRPVSSHAAHGDQEVTGRAAPTERRPSSGHAAAPKAPSQRPPQSSTQRNRTPQGQRVNQPQHYKPVRMSREGSHKNTPPPKPPVSKKKIIALSVLGVITALFISLAVYGLVALQGLDYDDSIVPNAYVDESTLASSDDVINILFIGSDARSEVEGQRSDTMLLFSIDKQNKKLKLTSFLRDSYVYIPSKKYNTKLNAAFSYGGTQLVLDTLEYNFGVKIDHYIMVNFKVFRQLVNLLGGITVDGVTEAEAKYMREEVKIKDIKEGTNHMTGKAALWYCRIRYVDNDFRRTERQRKVIGAIVDKALKTNPVKLMSIVKQVLPNISTDISSSELVGLAAGAALRFLYYDIEQQQIPAEDTWTDARISGQLVLKMDLEKNREILKSFLYDKDK